MDHINPSNIHLISSCDLNTKFNDRCHSDWSKSNLIAFVTLDGIYILKPQLDTPHGPFQIQLIKNLNVRFRHSVISSYYSSFDNVWQTLSHIQYMQVFMDPALTTNVEKLSLEIYPRRFRIIKWSPIIDVYPRQCFLATITVDYQLIIYSYQDPKWTQLIDLSSEYDQVYAKLAMDEKRKETSFDSICRTIHSLSFCYVCWKQIRAGEQHLLCATITGDIILWKMKFSNHQAGYIEKESLILISIIRTNLEYISAMQLIDDFLFVSARDGQVVLYDLAQYFVPTKSDIKSRHIKDTKPTVTVISPATTLWHRDNIEVPDFYIQSLTPNLFRIVLSKSTNICWANIGFERRSEYSTATLTMSDSYSAIDGLDPDVSLHQTPATWLKPAGEKRAVLIADDGSFFQLEFTDSDRQDSVPDFDAVRTGKIDLSRMVPRGLCTSPNGHLISMISCLTLQYEPNKILAPTKVIILPTLNDWKFLVDCVGSIIDENWLKSKKISSPMDMCDRIDYLISVLSLLNQDQFVQIYRMFRNAITNIDKPKDDTQFIQLKMIGTIIVKMIDSRQSKMLEGDHLLNVERNLQQTILNYYIEGHINHIITNIIGDGTQSTLMNLSQLSSLRNYRSFIEQSSELVHLKDKYSNEIKGILSKYSDLPVEKCPICKDEIPFTNFKHGICSNKHIFHRCVRSLNIIDLRTERDLVCPTCKFHYSKNLVWPSENLWLCIFCQ